MREILSKIWGDAKGWAFVALKDPQAQAGKGWSQKSFHYPDQMDDLLKFLEVGNKRNCAYFCPHLFKAANERTKRNSMPISVVWSDKDFGALNEITNFELQPALCWQTSEGKYQSLWRLNEALAPEIIEVFNKKVTKGIKGDPSGWDIGQMLRVPESVNYKYSPPFHGTLLWDDGPTVTPRHFTELKIAILESLPEDAPALTKIKVPTFEEALIEHGHHLPAAVWRSLRGTVEKTTDRSDRLWNLECMLVEAGLPLNAVFALAKGSPWNKYKDDQRPDQDLWKDVYKVYTSKAKPKLEPVEAALELPWMPLDSLLLYSERPEWLVEDIWMSKNVGWIAGEGKSYKSVLSLDLALSVASGTPFLGRFQVKHPGTVLMVQEEDPIWRVAHRVQAMAAAKGCLGTDVSSKENGLVLNFNKTNLPLFISIGGKLTFQDNSRMDALQREIEAKRPQLVVLDPMFMLSAGMDEFKAGEMAGVLTTLKHWRNEYECAISVVHHNRKSSGADTQKLYGSMALYAWSENSLMIERESRDTNLISIRRDIKDAPSDERLAVEFINIDEEYAYIFRDISTPMAGNRVADVLRRDRSNKPVSIAGIMALTDLSERKVRDEIKFLEKAGMIETSRSGLGGTQHIQTTPAFHLSKPDDEELILA